MVLPQELLHAIHMIYDIGAVAVHYLELDRLETSRDSRHLRRQLIIVSSLNVTSHGPAIEVSECNGCEPILNQI